MKFATYQNGRKNSRVESIIFSKAGAEKREIPRREADRRLHVRPMVRPDGSTKHLATYGRFYNVRTVIPTTVYDHNGRRYTRSEARAHARAQRMRAVFYPE